MLRSQPVLGVSLCKAGDVSRGNSGQKNEKNGRTSRTTRRSASSVKSCAYWRFTRRYSPAVTITSWRALAALGVKLLAAAALALPMGAFAANKTFTGPGNFSDNTKWNGNSLPAAGDNLTIKGACTFDNSASNL